ncbi:MAG TPA: helix-turn-helix domain-containing protein [Ktedonobacteraceae bacterium]|nr:helix-turn-helix domain-containing protein [Ktedonobacteraceae bacterium]
MRSVNGELIRQIRRQYNLTQTELGGERFSKSYVSAVERNKIVPSQQALEYFAERLGKPGDYFTSLIEPSEDMKQMAVVDPLTLGAGDTTGIRSEELTLLDILLEDGEVSGVMGRQQLRALSPQVIAALPAARQARYHFLLARKARREGALAEARQEFERALVLAPVESQIAILNELGLVYYLAKNYQTALAYHQRALQLWQEQQEKLNGTGPALGFKVEFNCGNDYRALAAYHKACEHYERARRYLSTEHDMRTAASLYYGLGYCIYGATEQAWNGPNGHDMTPEVVEREYQRANSFLLQSRTLYQVGGNRLAEARVRLVQARVLLDLCERRQQLSRKSSNRKVALTASSTGLLSEAEEQCRQVLLIGVEEADNETAIPAERVDSIIYVACAYLVQIFVRHAALARLSGYRDTATRELMIGASLCGEIIKSLPHPELPLSLARYVGLFNLNVAQQGGSTVELTVELSEKTAGRHSPFSMVEVCIAAGEVAEELGYSCGEENASDWFEHANHWLQAGLKWVRAVVQSGECDYGYMARSYRRCFDMLDERMEMAPELAERTTGTLVSMLKEAVGQLSRLMLYEEEIL